MRLVANNDSDQLASGAQSMERNLPVVFSAAGLIVPDPSIRPPLIPFIDADAGMD